MPELPKSLKRQQRILERSYTKRWVKERVALLVNGQPLSVETLTESLAKFRQENHQINIDITLAFDAAIRLGLVKVALALIEPLTAILQERAQKDPENAWKSDLILGAFNDARAVLEKAAREIQ